MNPIEPINFFEDWWNNYLTLDRISFDYGITQEQALELINQGRIAWDKRAEMLKGIETNQKGKD